MKQSTAPTPSADLASAKNNPRQNIKPAKGSRRFSPLPLAYRCLLLAGLLFVPVISQAASTYYWTSTVGGGTPATDGGGTWGTSSANWLLSDSGTAGDWVNNNNAIIGNGGTPGLIALSGTPVVDNVTFQPVASGWYTFQSSDLRLGAGSGFVSTILVPTGVTADFGNGASSSTFLAQGAGANGLICAGGGTLILSFKGRSTYTGGTYITNGTTVLVYSNAAFFASSNLTLNSGTLAAYNNNLAPVFANPVSLAGNFTLGGPSPHNTTLTFGTGAWTLSGGSWTLTVDTASVTNNSAIGQDLSGRGFAFSSTNGGKLTLGYSGTEGYTGPTTINSNTLALMAGCNLNAASGVSIAAGGILDVSAQTTWTAGSTASPAITASGTGTPATIKGGTTVALGASPITLNYDGVDDTMMTISQGALTMNGNVITINGSSTLAHGAHNIIAVTGGSITLSATPTVNGTAIAAGDQASVSTSGGTPNYVVINVGTAGPVVTSPTKSAIGTTTATLGATVVSDNGSTITDYGVVWGTSANPTTANNKVQVGTTESLGAFTTGVTGLPVGTVVHYRGYAVSGVGTGYSADDSFTTITNAPTMQAGGVGILSTQGGAATISWIRGNGANCIVLVNASTAVNANPTAGTTYTAGAILGGGSQIGTGNYVVFLGTGNSVTITGLTPSSTYYAAVYELNGSGGSENYLLPPATGSQTTVAHPVTYYSGAATGDPTVTSSWWTATNGTGANPGDFLGGDTFIIQNGAAYIPNANWTVNATEVGTAATVQINSGGSLILDNGSSGFGLLLGGNFVQNGGIGASTSRGSSIEFTSNGSWTGSGDMSGSTAKINVTIDPAVVLTASGMNAPGFKFKTGNTVTMTVNGTLDIGTRTIDGNNSSANADFVLGANGTLICANTGGLGTSLTGSTGTFTNFSATTKVTLPMTANYTFNGAAAQVTGASLPATVNNLTLNNSAGITLSQATTVNGTLALTAGVVTGSAILGGSATLSGGSSSAYLNGQLTVPFSAPASAAFTFPVGTATAYSPISLANFTDSGSDTLTASATAAQNPNQGTSTIDNTKYIARYWSLTENGGFVSPTYDLTGTFVAGDVQGGANTATLVMEKWDGSSWTPASGNSSTSTTVTGTGFTTDFGQFAAGDPATLPTVILATDSAITNTSATLGATVQSDSGSTITDYGIVWSTSPNPTTANTKVSAGSSVSPPSTFTVNATGLPVATTIYFRGYATSAAGTAYSPGVSFLTLANEPTTPSSVVMITSSQGGSATVSWTRGNGANCIVLVNAGSAVDTDPVDGTTYTANANFGDGSQIGSDNYAVFLGTGNSVTLAGLAPSTTYYVAVYELNGAGGSENYLTVSPATGNQTTPAHPVIYYSGAATGDPTQTSSWWTATNGTGANPSDFLGGDTFIIQTNQNYTEPGGDTWTVSGGATVQVNPGGTLYLNVASSSGTTFQLGGNLVQNGTFGGTGSANGGGILEFTSNGSWTGSGDISANKMGIKVDGGATLTASGTTSGILFGNPGNNSLSINVNGTLDMGTKTINANGRSRASFALGSSGTLICANTGGLGAITGSPATGMFYNFSALGNVTLPATASYDFDGTAAQITSTNLPANINNLIISNSVGVAMSQATTVGGTLTVNANSILDFNGQALTVASQPALNGTLTMEVTNTGGSFTGSELILESGTLAYGGNLTVTSSGTALAGGDKITLFEAPAFDTGSSFSTINYPVYTLQPGQSWSAAGLTVDGSIMITSTGPSGPGLLTNSISGSTLTLTWPAGQSWRLVGQTNSLSTGLNPNSAAWGTVTGVSDGSATITVNPHQPAVFYRLVYP